LVPLVFSGGMPPSVMVPSVVLGAFLALLSAIDFSTFRLPDVLTLPLIVLGLLFVWWHGWDDVTWRAGAAAAGAALLFAINTLYGVLRGRDGLGGGDAKLFAASGAWLGFSGLPSVLLYACGLAGLALLIRTMKGETLSATTRLPFGPFLALGTWLVWLYGGLEFPVL
jgi:leader peptidase (prepilin peptidase) / N-methyltransferase